ncbi:hypothetical protein Q1695_010283 [Nippostrongylus brasiliensis]|nr:hypothetical protein Q1695_010283 [Nippostrongylus brasiliensis]
MASIIELVDLTKLIDNRHLGCFIGKKGCNLKRIEQSTKAILQLETDADSCIRVRITGVPLAVAAAKIEIHELVLAIIRESFRHTVTVPSRFVGLIIGRNGKKIENVKLTTGANIKIGRNENGFTKVSIVGNYRRIVAAVTMIKDRVDSVGTATSVYDRPDRQEFHELLNEAMGDSSM